MHTHWSLFVTIDSSGKFKAEDLVGHWSRGPTAKGDTTKALGRGLPLPQPTIMDVEESRKLPHQLW